MPVWLGIDIGSASVKAVAVRSTYRKLAVAQVAATDVPPGGSVAQAIREAVANALEGQKQGIDGIAVALDGNRAAIHRLALPTAAQRQLEDVLAYELESQVPFDMASAVFDWRLLGWGTTPEQVSLVAGVARIDDVRARIDLVREAIAQEPERVGVGALALWGLVPYLPSLADEGPVAIVDLGAKATEVLIIEQGEALYARTLSTGTDGLPAAATRLARDIRVSFAAHRSQGGDAPSRVYLCGGGAFAPGAEGFLSGELEIPVQLLPPPSLDTTALGPDTERELPRYAKAVALALSLEGRGAGLNLRRGALAFERGFSWIRERIPVLVGLGSVILVSFVFSAWARIHSMHRDRETLTEALQTVTKDVLGTSATSAQDAQDLIAKAQSLRDEDPMPHADAFDVMVDISKAVPMSMTHDIDELDVQRGHVVIRGVVGSIPDAQSIASTLADDACLRDVKIKSTTQAVGSDRQKYVVEFDQRCPQDEKAPTKKKSEAASSPADGSEGR
jgi:general secretion pathway protein L